MLILLLKLKRIVADAGMCDSGSDKAVAVAEQHAVNSNPMKPPFPAGTELAMFGLSSLLHS